MKCARVQLLERSRQTNKPEKELERPRRYCQKRLVNPNHEDPKWVDYFKRFYYNEEDIQPQETLDNIPAHQSTDNLFLTVQTLKFQGQTEDRNRQRATFKYKTLTDAGKHRMFVKQIITNQELTEDGRFSQLTCYYFDDYIKYLFINSRSRPTSGKSTAFLQGLGNKIMNHKAAQVDISDCKKTTKYPNKFESQVKQVCQKSNKHTENPKNYSEDGMENSIISYKNSGQRKSLTISRAQSPESVQVIRVDVVCNYNSCSTSEFKYNNNAEEVTSEESEENSGSFNIKNNNYANKYLLKNTVKTLDEKLSGGAKVTLLCKTFKLSDRGNTILKTKNSEQKPSKTALS